MGRKAVVLLLIFVVMAAKAFWEFYVFEGSGKTSKGFAKTFKDDWHGSCKVIAFAVPHYFPKPVNYSNDTAADDAYDTLGTCEANRMDDGLWFVKGVYYNHRMKADGIPAINYEAVMFENNDKSEPAVQHYGTQYDVCSVAIGGVDRTGEIRYNKCGDGRYILEYKKKYGI